MALFIARSTPILASQFSPANETAAMIFAEKCILDGALLTAVAYGRISDRLCDCYHSPILRPLGVNLTLSVLTITVLVHQKEDFKDHPKRTWAFLVYVSALLILGTIGFAANAKFNELLYITNRDYPGGPLHYFLTNQSIWEVFSRDVIYFMTVYLQDLMLVCLSVIAC
jgi:hypothetical protein